MWLASVSKQAIEKVEGKGKQGKIDRILQKSKIVTASHCKHAYVENRERKGERMRGEDPSTKAGTWERDREEEAIWIYVFPDITQDF